MKINVVVTLELETLDLEPLAKITEGMHAKDRVKIENEVAELCNAAFDEGVRYAEENPS